MSIAVAWRAAPMLLAAGLVVAGLAACGGESSTDEGLSSSIKVDGSSGVTEFAQQAADEFTAKNPGVKVTVGESGDEGGFEKFCVGETDAVDASRPIAPEEAKLCGEHGVSYGSFPVAADGISVVSNQALEVGCLSTAQLAQLWGKGSDVETLAELGRDANSGATLPGVSLNLYGPPSSAGAFDLFNQIVNGSRGDSRSDYHQSLDDSGLADAVAADAQGLGYLGFAAYQESQGDLHLLGVDGGQGCILPSVETVQDGSYPLDHPLFFYVSADSLSTDRSLPAFVRFVAANAQDIAEQAGYVPLGPDRLEASAARLEQLIDQGR